jgi:crotonobetainyl-CoA:carnitine CoA-transferase CaiB-like acyl-CoA transferase
VAEYEHPTLGLVRGPATPLRLDEERPAPVRGPRLGEHTHEVLGELCGYSKSHLGRLEAAGVFGATSEKEER